MTFKLRCIAATENKGGACGDIATTATNGPADHKSVAHVAIVAVAPPPGMARCSACAHFEGRPGERPDGWCSRLAVETWAAPLFECRIYRPPDAALVDLARRRHKVADQLRSDPGLRYAFDVQGASPIGPASAPVSVVLALRDSTGAIVSGELIVPGDRWPGIALFTAYWNGQGRPS